MTIKMRILPLYLLVITLLVACHPITTPTHDLTTNTHSTQFSTDSEKIAFLDQYLVLHSPVQATEFHIVYHDNSSGRVPGPSDWIIVAAIKVDPADIPQWTKDRVSIDPANVNLTHWQGVLPTTEQWVIHSELVAFQSGDGAVLVIYAEEGIVLFRSSTMG